MVEAAGGRNVWLVGGGELVGAFADAGLLDEIQLEIAPVTLGAGAPLLPRRLLASDLSLVSLEGHGQFIVPGTGSRVRTRSRNGGRQADRSRLKNER